LKITLNVIKLAFLDYTEQQLLQEMLNE